MFRRNEAGWSNPKVLTIFVLIFVCGIAFGAAGTRAFFHTRTTPQASTTKFEYLSEQLQLSADQKQVVMQVLDDYAKYYENLEEDRENVAEHGKRQILKVLRPDQQKRFLQIFHSSSLPGRHSPNE